jgi:WD40-like Beta Propeller Repeat
MVNDERTVFFLFALMSLGAVAQQNLEFDKPPLLPTMFNADVISTGMSERDFAISPDGTEVFYTLQSPLGIFQAIVQIEKMPNGRWAKPQIASFSGKYSDLEPAFSSDGKKIYFASNRPVNGTEIKDFDIWVVEKQKGGWGEPKNIGLPVNTAADEFYPSISKCGNLYFTAAYKNAVGKEDIYQAKWENGKYSDPAPMDTAINSKLYEFNAYVSPDEDYIIFTSYGRKDDKGKGDLYMSIKDAAGKWLPAKNLAMLNSERLDYCPFVSFDKKILFYTSERSSLKKSFSDIPVQMDELVRSFTSPQNGGGDIYWVSFDTILSAGYFKQSSGVSVK